MDDPLVIQGILILCAFAAGSLNSIAGGGTLITFPALISIAHLGPVAANATSTVALVPGSIAGSWGYRQEMQQERSRILLLLGPSLVGGLLGSLLVTLLPEKYFAALVPWLILLAALLFMLQPRLLKWSGAGNEMKEVTTTSRTMKVGVVCFQLLVGIYGGYFGAGIGILMLSTLGVMGVTDIHRMNAVKTVLASVINLVAVVVFIVKGVVVWKIALVMVAASILGGYLAARIARKLNRSLVRVLVSIIGLGLAGYYFVVQYRHYFEKALLSQ